MWESGGLVVSLPAVEMASVTLPGSIFSHQSLLTSSISHELRRAILLIERSAAELGHSTIYVVRPEMFTHGESLSWLHSKLGTVRDHLCISDASTIRVIPGMRNHVFFYALGRRDAELAMEKLERRAPELAFTISTQVNSALRFKNDRKIYSPPFVAIQGRDDVSSPDQEFYKFYLGPHSIEESVDRVLRSGPVEIGASPMQHLLYAPFTEASAADSGFSTLIASAVAKAFFERTQFVIIRLPFPTNRAATLADRMNTALTALRSSNVAIPSVTAANVFLATDDTPSTQLSSLSDSVEMVCHDTFDFWRHSPSFYATFGALSVSARRNCHSPTALSAMLAKVCGRAPEILWPLPSQRRDRSRVRIE